MNFDIMFTYFPRVHTAIAEWLACLLFMRGLTLRGGKTQTALLSVVFGAALLAVNVIGEKLTGFGWLAMMVLGMLLMLGMLLALCKLKLLDAVFRWGYAFTLAEFAASLEWLIGYYLLMDGILTDLSQTYWVMAVIYLLVYVCGFFINHHCGLDHLKTAVTAQEALTVSAIVLFAFALSNMNFVFIGSAFARSQGAGVLYSRTLVDLGGLLLLYLHEEERREVNLQFELEAMENLFNHQYEQYRQYEANNEELHRIYHDLKHQIAYLESEPDAGKRIAYLADMKQALNARQTVVRTNSSVLDTLLTSKNALCMSHGITMRCYADAEILRFINVMDLCAIFGNAIDNAMESEMKVSAAEKRLITVDVYRENQFAAIRIANYCEQPIALDGGLPETTKSDKRMHGYGLKSIRRTVEKYHGHLSLAQEDGWFTLMLLIPLPGEG